jgi:hypothetical protein
VRGQARFVRAEVYVVGDAIAVPIPSAGVRGATAVRRARLFGPEILSVRHPVAVPVGAAAWLGAWLIRTVVIHIANPVAIGVHYVREPRAAIVLKWARFGGAIVFAVAHPIAIGVGTALGDG